MSGDLLMLARALTSPAAAHRAIAHQPRPVALATLLVALVTTIGLATLPRQLVLLDRALAPSGNALRDLHYAAMHAGLLRVIVVDRLVPPPTLVLAGILLVLAADPVLAVAENRRRILWAIAVAGLTPLVVQRLGELVVTYLAGVPARPIPGDPISLPQRFATGALLFWWRDQDPPAWLLAVNSRLSLIGAWSVAIWCVGIRQLDREPPSGWHVALPAGCLALAALITYWLRWLTTALLLGAP